MTLILTSILMGTWGLTVALLVVRLFRLELRITPAIINAIGIILLFASSIYLLKTGADMLTVFKSGKHSYFGSIPFLTAFFAWPFVFGILPQLLWLKVFRQELISLAAIAFVWIMTIFFVPWGTPQLKAIPFTYVTYVEMVAIYAAAFLLVYRLTAKKEIIASLQNARNTRLKKYASSY